MFLFDKVRQEDVDKLPADLKELFLQLKALLEKVLIGKLDTEKSSVEIKRFRKDLGFSINVQPKDNLVPSLKIDTYEQYSNIYVLDSHESDYERNPKKDKDFIKDTLTGVQHYFNGVTIVLHYGKRGNLIKKIGYWGLNTETDKHKRMGTIVYGFLPFRRVNTIKKITCRLLN